jgi:hypothetical protein
LHHQHIPPFDAGESVRLELAHIAPIELRRWREQHKIKIAARTAIAAYAAEASRAPVLELTEPRQVEARLSAALDFELPRAEAATKGLTGDDNEAEGVRVREGRYERDELLAAYIESALGNVGKQAAPELRKDASAEWAAWQRRATPAVAPAPPWAKWRNPTYLADRLARVLLVGKVLDELKAQTGRPRLEVISSWGAERVAEALLPSLDVRDVNGRRALVNGAGRPLAFAEVPALDAELADTLFKRDVSSLATPNGYRVVWWEISTGFKQAEEHDRDPRTYPRPHVLAWVGGWEAFEDLANVPGDQARRIVRAQAYLQWPLPDGMRGNMVILRERENTGRGRAAHRGKRSRIEIELSTVLLDDLNGAVPRSRVGQHAKKLVPLFDPDTLPLQAVRANERAALLGFVLRLTEHLRLRAGELRSQRAVYVPAKDRETIATEAGLPLSVLPKAMNALTRDDNTPALLAELARDHFTLAPARRAALALLLESASMEAGGRRNGLKAAASKRQLLLRSR